MTHEIYGWMVVRKDGAAVENKGNGSLAIFNLPKDAKVCARIVDGMQL